MEWKEFKQAVKELYKFWPTLIPAERRNKMYELEKDYLDVPDSVERKKRQEQLKIINFESSQFHLFILDKELFKKAEELDIAKIEKAIKRQKEEESKLAVKDETLIISERAINYIFGHSKIKGVEEISIEKEELDAELMWIIDFLSREISNQWGFENKKDNKELVLFNKPNAFFNFISSTEIENRPCVWELGLIASEVRKKMNLSSKEISIKKLVDLFKRLSQVFFNIRMEPILFDPEKNEWHRLSTASPLFRLIKDEIGIISNRWQTKDVELRLRFSSEYPLGWLMIGNLSCGRKGRLTLPEGAYKKLSLHEQNLLREIRLWKNPPNYSIQQWGKIAGYKTINITWLKKYLKKALSSIKRNEYIREFHIVGKGSKAVIKIIK